jgi:glycosyltransferase involved in cell wall biosynthesis
MKDATNNPVNQPPLVTVALAVLNGGTLLEGAMRSILKQSWPHWELLLLDDGSSDGAIERLPFLNDPRIIVVRDGCNRGLSTRLNQAVFMAKGKYFARMDHDDISHPERFARQVAFLEGNPHVDLLATQCLTMDEHDRLIGLLPYATDHADICRRPWQGFHMAHPSWMGKTEWFLRNSYLDPAPYCCEDQELLLRSYYSSCYHTIPDRLLAYRVRTHTPWQKQFQTRTAMGKFQVRHFLARGKLMNATLSWLTQIIRIAFDGLKKINQWASVSTNVSRKMSISSEECLEWESLFGSLKTGIERSCIKATDVHVKL